jgi:hypothetical protein
MEADCKSVGVCLRRFESCTCHSHGHRDHPGARSCIPARGRQEVADVGAPAQAVLALAMVFMAVAFWRNGWVWTGRAGVPWLLAGGACVVLVLLLEV